MEGNPFVQFDKKDANFKGATLNPIKKSDVWNAMQETSSGRTILIRKTGEQIKTQLANILLPKLNNARKRLEEELNLNLTLTGAPPTEDVKCYAIKIDIPYKRYTWDEIYFEDIPKNERPFLPEDEVENIEELESIDVKDWDDVKNSEYVSGNRKSPIAPTKSPSPLEEEIFGDYVPGSIVKEYIPDEEDLFEDDFNAPADEEQAIAREQYNKLLDKLIEVVVDQKTSMALLNNIDSRADYDLTINQTIALQF